MTLALVQMLAGGLPQPRFNAEAVGSARHCVTRDGATVERLIPVGFSARTDIGAPPALVFVIDNTLGAGETVEVSLSEALHFVQQATGIDVASMLAALGAI